MKIWTILSVIALAILLAGAAGAAYVPLRTDVLGDKPEALVLNQSMSEVQFELKIPGLEISQGTLDGKRWDRAEIPGGGYELDLGCPEVPHFTRLLIIPATEAVQAQFQALETHTFTNIDLMPAQGNEPNEMVGPASPPVKYDQTVYQTNAFYPSQRVMIGEPALMRGMRVVALRINPVQYNPVTKELVVTTRGKVTVSFQGQDFRNVPTRQIPMSASWKTLLKSQSFNYDNLELDEQNSGSYLIICRNDASLNTIVARLVDWKSRKGHTVVVQNYPASPTPTTTSIKNIIQTAYNTWPAPPEHVLLIGDTDGTSGFFLPGWSPNGIDHPYTQLDGTDILADVAIGRFPIQDLTEAQVAVNKVLFYEKMPYTNDSLWYHQSVLTAGSGSGFSVVETNRWIKNRMVLAGFTRIDTFWYTMPGGEYQIPPVLTNAINNGVTYVNYRGYLGISGWTNGNIDALNNGRKLPFCTIITCGTGGFDGDSDMEHFFSVGTPTVPKGAIASIGTATWGTNTRCNNTVNMGVYAGVFDEGITQPGTALVRGKLELYNTYNANDPGSVSSFSLWNALAGDPGLELFTGAIQHMTCIIPDSISMGQSALTLTVNQPGVGPVEGATVCFFKDRDMQEVGLTNAAGQITLPTTVDSAGNLKVTITKHNYIPIVDSLNVVQAAVAVGYFSHSIDDDNLGGSQGDNDGVINPGEAVQIPSVFKNYGNTTTATGVSVTASETDPYVTLSNATQIFPNLAPGATGNSAGSFLVTVAANCPHGYAAPLNFTASSAQGSWPGLLELTVLSYDMVLLSVQASGSDTLLAPGETSNLILSVRNDGLKNAANLTASITSLDPLVTVNDGQAGFGSVAQHATANCSANPFNLTASINAAPGRQASMVVTYSANGATQADTLTLRLGSSVMTDPQGPDGYGYYCFDDTDINYTQRPVYNWIEIAPSLGGPGTQLNISDPWENADSSVTQRMPFLFRFYGQTTEHLTICSNGWVSPTPDVSFNDFRNYPIPSAIGPHGHLCAFWDDLITWDGTPSGHVFYWEDPVGHKVVIEWSHLKAIAWPTPEETFQIIIYDPVYFPTPTGDAEIVFQYNVINEVAGNYDDNKYSTVGIEDWDYQNGIEVVYWNSYHDPRTAHLQNGRAYKFTTACNYVQPGINLNVSLTPINPPIVIPAQGGTFSFNASVANVGTTPALFDAWIMQYTPLGQWQGPMLGPLNLTVPGGINVSRLRQQSVPGVAPAGVYTYRGYIGNYLNGSKFDSSSFQYTKSTARAGDATVINWENWGESFAPYLVGSEQNAEQALPTAFGLDQNRPNPFNPVTAISYELRAASFTSLKVFDISGRLVVTLVEGWKEAGFHEATFDGSRLASGLYFVKMQAGRFSAVKKMMLVK